MTILDIAISREGGVCKLAAALGVRQSRVSNWRSRKRIPDGWADALQQRYGGSVGKNSDESTADSGSAATESVAESV